MAYQATYYDNGLRHHVLEDRHFPFSAGQKATGTRTVYDALGRATRTERVKDLVITSTLQGDLCETAYDFTQSATVFTRTRTDYYEDGRIWKTIQENDLATTGDDAVTIYEYAADQLTKTTKLPPIIDGVTTTTDAIEVHDVNGNVLSSQTQSWVDGVLQSHRPQTRFYYDQMNRHLRTRVAPNETVSDDRTVPDTNLNGDLLKEIQYDLANRRSIETTWDSGAENVKTKFDYDGVGHLIQVTPGYQTLDHTVTKYDYDELGNVFAQYDGNQFDSNDNRIAGAKATRFEYDVLGRRTKRTLPAGGTPEDWTHDYAEAGDFPPPGKRINKIRHTDFLSQQLLTSFDLMGRPDVKKQGATLLVDIDYTAEGNRSRGRDNLNTSARETRYVYDEQNRLRIKNTPEGTLTYDYDFAGNLKTISARKTYTFPASAPYNFATINATGTDSNPSGAYMDYAYDTRNRLVTVNRDPGGGSNADATYTFDSVGNLAKIKYRNAVESAYTYDARNQLTLITASRSGSAVASFKYDDAAWAAGRRLAYSGQRRRLEETVNGAFRTIEYDYDSLRRLKKENCLSGFNSGTVTYDSADGYAENPGGFDRVGNRRKRDSTMAGVVQRTYAAYDANDRLGTLSGTSVAASFDANGNTKQVNLDGDTLWDQTVPDTYDLDNRLISATRLAGAITVVYDGDGNRVKKTVGSTSTLYLVDDRNPTGYAQVMEERPTTSGPPTVAYVYGLDLVSQQRGSTISYYGCDGLGSVRYLTDATTGSGSYGQVTDTYTYDAYGILLSPATPPANNNYLYTGEQFDRDLGLYYLRARYYEPELGRFWTVDTFEGTQSDPLSLHKYLYCHADPINLIDPSGLYTKAFGEAAHILIAGRYLAEHPGTIINPPTGILGSLKPDIFNGPGLRYAEIKPLSFLGIAGGFAQIFAYDQAYGKLNMRRETGWPVGFQGAVVAGRWIVYFNVQGIIFYHDGTEDIKDLKKIKDIRSAYAVLREIAKRNLRVLIGYARFLASGSRAADETRLQTQTGIAVQLGVMGKVL